jgi:tRNA/tmRNA/rRNA uracil-C5-methylase (TrmA/RlmC/RlmD family)
VTYVAGRSSATRWLTTTATATETKSRDPVTPRPARAGNRTRTQKGRSLVGERYIVEVERAAHGGHCVARHEGVVVFVRHTLPGERVLVEITDGEDTSKFLRGDAVEVLTRAPGRVDAPCRFSGPGACGGCDFQHVSLPAQRDLKAFVVREQLQRLAGLDIEVTVEPVPGDDDGLYWRTRLQYAVDADGRPGLRKHRSHDVVPVDTCPIGHPDLPDVTSQIWPDAEWVEAIISSSDEQLRLVSTHDGLFADGPQVLHERAAGRSWQVTGSGFWQVHPGAADMLVSAVLDGLAPRPGEQAADLYSGVGLFSAALAERVGSTGAVVAVESDPLAVYDAEQNLADLPEVTSVADRVNRALRQGTLGETRDLVVLDPPRSGAKRAVVEAIVRLRPRAVAYVACDPAALARDVAIFAEHGYGLTGLRAFDIFPMTHHVECVAILEPPGASG